MWWCCGFVSCLLLALLSALPPSFGQPAAQNEGLSSHKNSLRRESSRETSSIPVGAPMFRHHRAEPCDYCPNVSMFVNIDVEHSADIPVILARLAASAKINSIVLTHPTLEADIVSIISKRGIDNVRVVAKTFAQWRDLVATKTGLKDVSITTHEDVLSLRPMLGLLFEELLSESQQAYWGWADSNYILGDLPFLLRAISGRVVVYSTQGELWTSSDFAVVRNSNKMNSLVRRIMHSPSVQNSTEHWLYALRSSLQFAWMQNIYKAQEVTNEPCNSHHASWLFVAGAIATERVEGCWFIDRALFNEAPGAAAIGGKSHKGYKLNAFFADSFSYSEKYILGAHNGNIQIFERIPEDPLRMRLLNGKTPLDTGDLSILFLRNALSFEQWCLHMYDKHGSDLPSTLGHNLSSSDEANLRGRNCELYSVKRRSQHLPLPMCDSQPMNRNTIGGSVAKSPVVDNPRPLIAIMSATTSRHVLSPSIGNLALFNILWPSLVKHLDCGYDYLITVAFDIGDMYYDSREAAEETREWFKSNFQDPLLEVSHINATLLMVRFNNTLHRPGPAMNAMARAAYDAGADYFYRVNDDTEIQTPFASAFIQQLASVALGGVPVGVLGPSCAQGNTQILTHDFVHRTHMEIFNKIYYPVELVDWFLDNWISAVYGCNNTLQSTSVSVTHHTGAHGQRYMATNVQWVGILQKTRNILIEYIEKRVSVHAADAFRASELFCSHAIRTV